MKYNKIISVDDVIWVVHCLCGKDKEYEVECVIEIYNTFEFNHVGEAVDYYYEFGDDALKEKNYKKWKKRRNGIKEIITNYEKIKERKNEN